MGFDGPKAGFPFVLLSVNVSDVSESPSQSAQPFPRVREAFRGARSPFRGFGKLFAACAALSEDSESFSRSAQPFPRVRKAFRGARSPFRGFGKLFAECAALSEGSESIFPL